MLKFISWNVNGLRACYDKGFVDVFHRLEADFFCLQETKMQEGQLDAKFEGYHSYWNYAEKKGYSGTAIFSKVKPLSVTYGLGIEEHDHEGRVITLELESFYLITVYTPNSQEELRRLDYRMKWEDDFRVYLKKLEGIYSWWSYRFKAREKNSGWRIDYFLTSDSLKDRLKGAHIYTDIFGSDHCPVELTIEL